MRAKAVICGILALALVTGGCKEKHRNLTTDLHRAAGKGDLAQVQTLIARGGHVDARDHRGRTPLHWAAYKGHKEVAEVLVRCGANIDSFDDQGRTPAVLAMQERSASVAKYLVQAGATVNLHLAVYLGDTTRVASLIQGGANVNVAEDSINGWTPLHYAARYNRKEIADLLITAGANINAKDEVKRTPLHIATEEDFTDMVELLLARGADVSAKGEVGNTALNIADVNTARLLLTAGANVEARNEGGETPLYLAAESGWTQMVEVLIAGGANVDARMVRETFSRSPLEIAVENGHIDVVRLLAPKVHDINAHLPLQAAIRGNYSGASARFEREHPDPNATYEERQAAAERGMDRLRILMIELLLAHGADVNGRSEDGWTPLHCAACGGLKDIAELLLKKGADVNAQDHGGDAALHCAALHGHKGVVELLIAHGANVNARNSRGRTPLDEAIRRGHKEIVPLLTAKAKGAGASVPDGGTKK